MTDFFSDRLSDGSPGHIRNLSKSAAYGLLKLPENLPSLDELFAIFSPSGEATNNILSFLSLRLFLRVASMILKIFSCGCSGLPTMKPF
ncbi:hypothetical protein [Roseicyclus marinus]|uniref:hypothetical protein n=1 Tax=Roseicyclus marinus TaxID=2161673 RepID=UPI0030C6BB78